MNTQFSCKKYYLFIFAVFYVIIYLLLTLLPKGSISPMRIYYPWVIFVLVSSNVLYRFLDTPSLILHVFFIKKWQALWLYPPWALWPVRWNSIKYKRVKYKRSYKVRGEICTNTKLMVIAGLEPGCDASINWTAKLLKLFHDFYLNLLENMLRIENQWNQNIYLTKKQTR